MVKCAVVPYWHYAMLKSRLALGLAGLGTFIVVAFLIFLISSKFVTPSPMQHTSAPIAATATTTAASTAAGPQFGVIYENRRFIKPASVFSAFSANDVVLYDFSTGATTTLKAPNGYFTSTPPAATWSNLNGSPILLVSARDIDATHTDLSVWNMNSLLTSDTMVDHSSVVNPYSSSAYAPSMGKLAYCGPNGEYIVLNLSDFSYTTLSSTSITQILCQVAFSGNPPVFSPDGSVIYTSEASANESGTPTGTVTPVKLTIKTDTVTPLTSYAAFTQRGLNTDRTRYVDPISTGFVIYDTSTTDLERASLTTIESTAPVVARQTLNLSGALIGNAVFTVDGKGMFYYTTALGGTSGVKPELGYYDLVQKKNYYPIDFPRMAISTIDLLGAYDENTLLLSIASEPFEGQMNSQTGAVISERGSSTLFRATSKGVFTAIDSNSEGFDLQSFVKGK